MTSLYTIALPPVIKGLRNAAAILTKGLNHANANNIDPSTYTTGQLHPDMRDLSYQVWRLTDSAKAMVPRINPSIPALTLPDTDTTVPELLARIKKTIDYLEAVKPEDLDGREQDDVVLKFQGADGKPAEIKQKAVQYVLQFGHPNFWFHVVAMYAILRMKGVDVGKMDYMNGAAITKVPELE